MTTRLLLRRLALVVATAVTLVACGPGSGAWVRPPNVTRSGSEVLKAEPAERFRINTAELAGELARLPADERAEQIADWAVAGTLARVAGGSSEVLEALAKQPALRSPRLEVLGVLDYGPGRYAIVSPRRAFLFVPAEDADARKTLARLADRVRAELGRTPEEFEVVRFQTVADATEIFIEDQGTVRGADLFTEAYGYIEREVRSVPELERWLSTTDSLSYYAQRDDGIVLGGRRLSPAAPHVTVEQIATLYQGHLAAWPGLRNAHGIDRYQNRMELEFSRLVASYNANVERVNAGKAPSCKAFLQALASLGRLFGETEMSPGPPCAGASPVEVMRAHASILHRIRPVLERVSQAHAAAIESALATPERTESPGFSLDPQWDGARLIADLELLKSDPDALIARARAFPSARDTGRGAPLAARAASTLLRTLAVTGVARIGPLHPSVVEAIDAIIEDIRKQGPKHVEDLPRFAYVEAQLEMSRSPQGALLHGLLHFIESQDRVQCARYEGALAGTRVGMNLFYTDLLAKLWAGLDYRGSAPTRSLPGFTTMQGLPLSAGESSTRIWFGARSDRTARNDDYSVIYFSPVVTRVYSAASNVLQPGKEAVPSDDVRHVLDWWTNHFDEVSEVESQYGLQNELQKWSLLAGALAYQDIFPALDGVKVERGLHFDTWVKGNPAAKLPPGIALLPASRWIGREPTWECLDLLASSDSSGVRTLYGGVSLADMRHARLPPLAARSGAYLPDPEQGRVHLSARDGKDRAWQQTELEPARLAPKTKQTRKLLTVAERHGDGVAVAWEDDAGRGGRFKAKWSGTDVILSAANLDASAHADVHAFAQLKRVQAEVTNAKALDAQARTMPRLHRTQHRSGDDDPPDPTAVEMRNDWRAAMGALPVSSDSPPDPSPSGQPRPHPMEMRPPAIGPPLHPDDDRRR